MKKVIISMVLATALILFAGCGVLLNDDSVAQDKIVLYVNTDYEILESFPYDELQKIKETYYGYGKSIDEKEEGEKKEKALIEKHLGIDTIVKSVYAYNENLIEFSCGGSGMLNHSTYTGFYYSKEDMPHALSFDGCELIETEPGVFEWEDERHKVYTEKIRDNWYYYFLQWI